MLLTLSKLPPAVKSSLIYIGLGTCLAGCGAADLAIESRAVEAPTCADILLSGPLTVRIELADRIELSNGGFAHLKGPKVALDTLEINTTPTFILTAVEPLQLTLECPMNEQMDRVRTQGDVALTFAQGAMPTQLFAYGSSNVNLQGFADKLEVRLSGQARLKLTQLEADELSASLSGASHMSVDGEANSLETQALGRSQLLAAELRVQSAKVIAQGTSNVEVWSSAHLNVSAAHGARVTYRGSPEVSDAASGGEIIQRQ